MESAFDINGEVLRNSGQRKYALGRAIQQQSFLGGELEKDLSTFLVKNEEPIRDFLQHAINQHRCIKYYMKMDIAFYREVDESVQRTTGGFLVPMKTSSDVNSLHMDDVTSSLLTAVDNFNKRGSNWLFDYVIKLSVRSAAHRPLQGSTYMKSPKELINKHAVLNIKNTDEYCFLYCVLAHIYHVKHHAEKPDQYLSHFRELKYEGLSFPLKVSDVSKFEAMNPDIAVNVLFYENKETVPLHPSSHRGRKYQVNVLLLESKGKFHYTLVRNLSRLVAGRTKHRNAAHVCLSCLHPFSTEDCLTRHIPECSIHTPQKVTYPTPENNKLKFKNVFKTMKVPFCLYLDMESFLIPQNEKNVKSIHEPSGFCVLRASEFKEFEIPAYTYSGPNVIDHLYDYLRKEEREIFKILNQNNNMIPLSADQEAIHESSQTCKGCKQAYSDNNIRTHHHCHISGNYIGPFCNNCNLQLKYRRTVNLSGYPSYFIPVIAHNMKSYDFHLIIKKFRQYEILNSKGIMTPVKISVIPVNTEKFMCVSIGGLKFIDSYQFLSSSLDTLVNCLVKSGADKFKFTNKHFNSSPLVYEKGIYCYEHMTGPDIFLETQLPPIEKFYSALNEQCITTEEYLRAQQMWSAFHCKSMRNYHDLYLTLDTTLLADIMENFRNISFNTFQLDPLHYISLPGYSYDACMKMTGVELDLITDPEQFLMFENVIRGGLSMITTRFARANNEFLVDKEEYNVDLPESCLMYWDANSLYSEAMSRPLPTGKFRFLLTSEIAKFNVKSIDSNSRLGYILEVKLKYPITKHASHSDYPLAPEHVKITRDMLSPYSQTLTENHITCEKLTPTLCDKDHYVLHYENLKLYLQLGMELENTYRILEFEQSCWLSKYIAFNVDRRKKAETKFEQDLSKLYMNSFFGKTLQNQRLQVNVQLINNDKRLKKLIAKPTCQEFKIINDDLVMVKMAKKTLMQNKPIFVGMIILDLSKYHMYDFHYNHIIAHFGDRATLCFTDTDSLLYHFQLNNIDDYICNNAHLFDTSNYPPSHPLYSRSNEKKIGCFKSETAEISPLEFVGLRPKCYSILLTKYENKMTCKGIKRGYVAKHVRHNMYLRTLRSHDKTADKFQNFQSKNHVIRTIEITTTCMSAADDKRYILNCGEKTLAYGHHRIGNDV